MKIKCTLILLILFCTIQVGAFENAPIDIIITNPTTGSVFDSVNEINIETEVVGTASKVSFYINNQLELEKTSKPFSYTILNPQVGEYEIKAIVTDTNGKTSFDMVYFTCNRLDVGNIYINNNSTTVPDGSFNDFSGDGTTKPAGWAGVIASSDKGVTFTGEIASGDTTKSLKISTPGGIGSVYPYLQSTDSNITGKAAIEFKVRHEGSTATTASLEVRDYNTGNAVKFFSMNSTTMKLLYKNTDGTINDNSVSGFELGKWYSIRIVFDTTTKFMDMYLDGVRVLAHKQMPTDTVNTFSVVKNFKLSLGGSSKAIAYFDDVRWFSINKSPNVDNIMAQNLLNVEIPFSQAVPMNIYKINVYFDIAVKTSTLTPNNISVINENGDKLPYTGVYTSSKKRYTLTLQNPMLPKNKYVVKIGKGVTDNASGNPMKNVFYDSFTTVANKIKLDTLSYSDDSGKKLFYLKELNNSNIKTNLAFTNNSGMVENVLVATCVYNFENKLVALSSKSLVLNSSSASQVFDLNQQYFDGIKNCHIKTFIWDSSNNAPVCEAEILKNDLDSELIFNSGFEAGSIGNNSGAITNITGKDLSLNSENDWELDLNNHPNIGSFSIQYEDGTATERYAKIDTDPTNSNNKILKYYMGIVGDSAVKGRVQSNIYSNNNLKQVYLKYKMYLHPDFEILKTLQTPITWLTVGEYWNECAWQDLKYPFRVTLGIGKEDGIDKNLYFKLNADTCFHDNIETIWSKIDNTFPIPTGVWLDCEVYYKEGDANNGRFIMNVTPEGGEKVTVLDVINWTYDPANPNPKGLTHFNPWKLYTDKATPNYVHNNGGALQIYWDDVAFYLDR